MDDFGGKGKGYEVDDADFEAAVAQPSAKDKYQLVYIIFLLHGIGILMPWNMFITAHKWVLPVGLSVCVRICVFVSNLVYLSTRLPISVCVYNAAMSNGHMIPFVS